MPDPKPFTPLPPQPESIPLNMSFRAVWKKPELGPEEFLFPYVENTVEIYDEKSSGTKTGILNSIGSHEPAEIFSNVFAYMVTPAMRPSIERPLFIALSLILDSEEYKTSHDEWRRWKQTQPEAMQDQLHKKACRILSSKKDK